jgi:hypothetical protein
VLLIVLAILFVILFIINCLMVEMAKNDRSASKQSIKQQLEPVDHNLITICDPKYVREVYCGVSGTFEAFLY